MCTIKELVQGFNDFLVRNFETLANVVPSYVDILVLFISQTQNRSINQAIIVCFNQLMATIGPSLGAAAWAEIIKTYSLGFTQSIPQELFHQTQSYLNFTQAGGPIKNKNAA